ncbi:hypothetical protein BABINDRAFT_22459, partial [Babjeviella inositovora NRRL Y-12698]
EKKARDESLHCQVSASPNERFSSKSIRRYKYCIGYCLTISLCSIPLGWDVGTIGGYTGSQVFQAKFGNRLMKSTERVEYTFDKAVLGLVVSVFSLGCAFGGLALGKLGDTYGRKVGILAATFMYVLGVIIQSVSIIAENWVCLCGGRVLAGLGVGSLNVIGPVLIGECAPSSIRGLCVSFYQVNCSLFIFLGQVSMIFLSRNHLDSRVLYSLPIVFQALWGIIITVLCISVFPESPRYLIQKSRFEEARVSLSQILHKEANDAEVTEELDYLYQSISTNLEASKPTNILRLLKNKEFSPMVLMGMILMGFQQLSGINYFFYYGNEVFTSIGLEDTYMCSGCLGLVNLVFSICAVLAIEKFGRKFGLLIGALAMAVFMLTYSSVGNWNIFSPKANGILMIAFTCCFIASFAMTWGPIPNLVLNEIYPIAIKQTSMSFAGFTNNTFNFIISLSTPVIVKNIGFGLGFIFCLCSFCGAAFVLYYVPETRNKTPEELGRFFCKLAEP